MRANSHSPTFFHFLSLSLSHTHTHTFICSMNERTLLHTHIHISVCIFLCLFIYVGLHTLLGCLNVPDINLRNVFMVISKTIFGCFVKILEAGRWRKIDQFGKSDLRWLSRIWSPENQILHFERSTSEKGVDLDLGHSSSYVKSSFGSVAP